MSKDEARVKKETFKAFQEKHKNTPRKFVVIPDNAFQLRNHSMRCLEFPRIEEFPDFENGEIPLVEYSAFQKLESLLAEAEGAFEFMLKNYGSENTAGCYEILTRIKEYRGEIK